MAITLTSPETRGSITEARIVAIGANVLTRTLVIEVQYRCGTEVARVARFEYHEDSTPSFTDVVNAVPEFGNLRRALETYLAATAVPGTAA